MKWPRHTVVLIVVVIVLLGGMNLLHSERVPEAYQFRNWPAWAHTVFGIGLICFVLYALWIDTRDMHDAWRDWKRLRNEKKHEPKV
ncbi:MAG TPA: hypothetical protein VEC99_19020 [Clostridia bacterium]|nr:hypothetical protein [Clostridia bacterium]